MVDLKTEIKLNSGENQDSQLWQEQCDCCTEGYCLMLETDSTLVLLWGSQPLASPSWGGGGGCARGINPFRSIKSLSDHQGTPSIFFPYFQITFPRTLPFSCTPSTSQILMLCPEKSLLSPWSLRLWGPQKSHGCHKEEILHGQLLSGPHCQLFQTFTSF